MNKLTKTTINVLLSLFVIGCDRNGALIYAPGDTFAIFSDRITLTGQIRSSATLKPLSGMHINILRIKGPDNIESFDLMKPGISDESGFYEIKFRKSRKPVKIFLSARDPDRMDEAGKKAGTISMEITDKIGKALSGNQKSLRIDILYPETVYESTGGFKMSGTWKRGGGE